MRVSVGCRPGVGLELLNSPDSVGLGIDLSSTSPTIKDDAEYNRLLTKYPKAMDAGEEHGWPTHKCISVVAQIEEQNETNELDKADGVAAALCFVVDTIHDEQQLEQKKERMLKQIVHMAMNQESRSRQLELFGFWVSGSASETKQEYDRLYARFTKAMLCGKKYDWPRHKCISVVQKIEAEVNADPAAAGDLTKAALDGVMKIIKAEKVLEQQKNWKLRRITYIITKKESSGQASTFIEVWATQMREEKAASQ